MASKAAAPYNVPCMEATSIEALIARLGEENPRWRAEAEVRLVKLGLPAVPALVAALRSPVVSVRVHAAQALAALRPEMTARAYAGPGPAGVSEVGDALADNLADTEANGAAAIAAERALVRMGAVTVLANRIHGPGGPRALRALGEIGSREASSVALIRAALTSPSSAHRTEAAVALLRIFGEDAIEQATPLLADPEKWVRYGVAEPLAKLGVRRSKPVLEAALTDEDEGPWMRGWAEELLSELEDAERNSSARE